MFEKPKMLFEKLDTSTLGCFDPDFFCFTGKDPVPIRCPVAGAFNFTQAGDFPFKTRILGGITKDPRHDVWGRTGQFSCKQNISRLAVCDTGIHIIHLSTIKFLCSLLITVQ